MKQTDKIIERNLKNSLQSRRFPKCFDSQKQYEEWLDEEAIANTFPVRRNICEDCKSFYKSQMILEGRCVNIQLVLKE
jgi:hypothetical protein